ncbi:MAG: hypothetical protein QXJ31_02750 [Candidatus Bathyarchaeia archaeon]
MDFVKPRRKISYRERIHEIGELLNKQGEVSLAELFKKWQIQPYYIRTLMQYAKQIYTYAEFDSENCILYIPERKGENKA